MISRISQGHRKDFYELTDQRFLGTEEFVDDIRRDLKERPSFVYDISIQELIDLEKRFREDEETAATITTLRESLTKSRDQYSFIQA